MLSLPTDVLRLVTSRVDSFQALLDWLGASKELGSIPLTEDVRHISLRSTYLDMLKIIQGLRFDKDILLTNSDDVLAHNTLDAHFMSVETDEKADAIAGVLAWYVHLSEKAGRDATLHLTLQDMRYMVNSLSRFGVWGHVKRFCWMNGDLLRSPPSIFLQLQYLCEVITSGSLRSLEKLFLGGNQIGDDGVKSLSTAIASGSLAKLTYLNLSSNQISDPGITSLSDAIASGSLGNLEILSLYGNQIGYPGMSALAGVMESLQNLKELHLGHNKIGDAETTLLSTAIANGYLENLKELWLEDNNIGDSGMSAVAVAIASGYLANLEWLWLSYNQIGDSGMSAVAGAIARGYLEKLKELWLNDNQIGDDGMKAFADAIDIGDLANLEWLCLSSNQIGDDGMKALSTTIDSGSLQNLKQLNLGGNQIGEKGVASLANSIASGSLASLKSLVVPRPHQMNSGLKAACEQRGIQLE